MLPAPQALPSSGEHTQLKHSTIQIATLSSNFTITPLPLPSTYPAQIFNNAGIHTFSRYRHLGNIPSLNNQQFRQPRYHPLPPSKALPYPRQTHPSQTINQTDSHAFIR